MVELVKKLLYIRFICGLAPMGCGLVLQLNAIHGHVIKTIPMVVWGVYYKEE